MSTQVREHSRDLVGKAKRTCLQQTSNAKEGDAWKEIFQIEVEDEGRPALPMGLCIGQNASVFHETVHAWPYIGCKLSEERQGFYLKQLDFLPRLFDESISAAAFFK